MKISAKGRYALAAMVYLGKEFDSGEYITILNISEKLGISKIYLEQIFSILKKSGVVNSIKGSHGGYQLSKTPDQFSVYDILYATENTLFEEVESTVAQKSPAIEGALKSLAFTPLEETIKATLEKITLYELIEEAKKYNENNYVFYI